MRQQLEVHCCSRSEVSSAVQPPASKSCRLGGIWIDLWGDQLPGCTTGLCLRRGQHESCGLSEPSRPQRWNTVPSKAESGSPHVWQPIGARVSRTNGDKDSCVAHAAVAKGRPPAPARWCLAVLDCRTLKRWEGKRPHLKRPLTFEERLRYERNHEPQKCVV
jgi:hypothetical protein